MVWFFIVNLLVAGSAIVTIDVGPYASQAECAAAAQAFNIAQARENVGGVLKSLGWGRSICIARSAPVPGP